MKQLATLALIGLMTVTLTGCGGDTHESVMDDMAGVATEMADTLKGVKDEASAKAAEGKLKDLAAQAQDLAKRMEALGEPSEEEAMELLGKLGPMMQAAQDMQKEVARIQADENLNKVLGDALKEAQGAMN